MKYHEDNDYKKKRIKGWRKEHNAGGFRCSHCRRWVVINDYIGTANRNHCNLCLWSKHVDEAKGDRKSTCESGMRPIGLTFKQEGLGKQGEIMLVHVCASCNKISINRVARDDDNDGILACFESATSLELSMRAAIQEQSITLLIGDDRVEVMTQLFGN
ncbi:MAG TPA: RNHCP domain-containing protein [Candidatus Saccharimonadales bacterium]|nr:RNHCP domain-containing protein [Candidatus Saccharimonadales bacterium]